MLHGRRGVQGRSTFVDGVMVLMSLGYSDSVAGSGHKEALLHSQPGELSCMKEPEYV